MQINGGYDRFLTIFIFDSEVLNAIKGAH